MAENLIQIFGIPPTNDLGPTLACRSFRKKTWTHVWVSPDQSKEMTYEMEEKDPVQSSTLPSDSNSDICCSLLCNANNAAAGQPCSGVRRAEPKVLLGRVKCTRKSILYHRIVSAKAKKKGGLESGTYESWIWVDLNLKGLIEESTTPPPWQMIFREAVHTSFCIDLGISF